MRLVYFHQYFATPNSNGGIRSYEMARRLVGRGVHVDLITSSAFIDGQMNLNPGWNCKKVDGINLHILNLPYSNKYSFLKRVWVFIKFAVMSGVYASKLKADLVFASSTPLTIGLPAVFASKRMKAPLIFEVRDLWPDIPIAMGFLKNPFVIWMAKWLEIWIYKNSSRIIALSPGMAEGVSRKASVPVDIIPNAADVDLFQSPGQCACNIRAELAIPENSKIMVYTGTVGLVNNVNYLVQLSYEFKCRGLNIRVVVVGEGGEKNEVQGLAQELGVLGDYFYFYPPVSKKSLPDILAQVDISCSTVLPVRELWDNSANKFFDALAAGLPIAINHGGWQEKIIQDYGVGVVMDYESPSAGADAVVGFIFNENVVAEAKRNSLSLAKEKFSRELLFEQFYSSFLLVLDES